jgi:hypothetical protein
MPDLRERFGAVDGLGAPDLWAEASRRARDEVPARRVGVGPVVPWSRLGTIAVAFAVFVAAVVFAWDVATPDGAPPPEPAVDLSAELPAGWSELPAPPENRSGSASAWTGRELLVWGGYVFEGTGDKSARSTGFSFDAATSTWTELPPSPLSGRARSGTAWTGTELLVWGGWDGRTEVLGDGAAYDPATRGWRRLPAAPIQAKAPLSVWTGEEMIVWGTSIRFPSVPMDGAAYDPQSDSWRRIAEAPRRLTDATAVWTGTEMVVFGSALDGSNRSDTPTAVGAAYDPATDTWRSIPASDLSPQAHTAAWPGTGEMIAWDYDHATAAYAPATDSWRPLPRVPLRFYECYPRSTAIDGFVFGDFCGSLATYSAAEDRWHDVSRPDLTGWVMEPVAAGNAFLVTAHSLELSEHPGREFDTRMFAFVPEGAFACAGTARVDPTDRSGARYVAARFLLLRVHDAEGDLRGLLTTSGRDAFASEESGLSPLLRGDHYLYEIVFIDGPLSPDDSFEVGVRLTTSPQNRIIEETLFLSRGENLAGESCPLLVNGARPGLLGP